MGNRAVVTWVNSDGVVDGDSVGVYLHWNGGISSIKAFLKYCEIMNYRNPTNDNYGIARFVQTIANFFGADGLSIGVGKLDDLDCDNGDNGMYICKGWKIIERQYVPEDCDDDEGIYGIDEMLQAINDCQPAEIQEAFDELYDNPKF